MSTVLPPFNVPGIAPKQRDGVYRLIVIRLLTAIENPDLNTNEAGYTK